MKVNNSFAGMLSRYGFGFAEKGGDDGWGYLEMDANIARRALLSPIFMASAGFHNNIAQDQAGHLGMFSGSTAQGPTTAYNMHVYADRAAPAVRRERYWGLSLRQ